MCLSGICTTIRPQSPFRYYVFPPSSSRKPHKTLLTFSSSSPAHRPYVTSQELPLLLHPQKEEEEEEEEELLPHLLLPDGISMLEKVDRKYKKKKKKKQQKKQRFRQFNDLWVRLEER